MTIDVGLRSPSDVNEGMCTDGGRDAAGNGCVDIWCSVWWSRDGGITGAALAAKQGGGAGEIGRLGARHVAFVRVNSPARTSHSAGCGPLPAVP